MVERAGTDAPAAPSRSQAVADALHRSARARWLLLFVAVYPLVAMWSLANPMFGSPDENLHMIRAQSIARGDFSDPFTTDGIPAEAMECFRFMQDVTADCMVLEWTAEGTEWSAPLDGYPPLFHAIAAVPAFLFSGLTGAYIMRLWLGAVVVAIVAWAGAIVSRPGHGPWPFTGFLVAVTPMAIFTMATVNPSGLSVSGALLATAAAVGMYARDPNTRDLRIALAVGTAILALTRRDGLVWIAAICVVLAPLVPWRAVRGSVGQWSRRTWTSVGIVAAVLALIAVRYGATTASRFYDNWRDGLGGNWWEVARFLRFYVYEAVAIFGWLDSQIGEETFLVAMIVAGTIALLGAVGDDRRLATATVLAVVVLLATPVLFGMIRFPYIQGRYLMPIWAAGLIVAGASVARAGLDQRLGRRLAAVLLGLWLVVHVVGAVQNLRRYAVGRSGSWGFMFDAAWHPPKFSNLVALLGYAVAFAVLAFGIHTLRRATADYPSSGDAAPA